MSVDLSGSAWAPYALITTSTVAVSFVNAFAGGGIFSATRPSSLPAAWLRGGVICVGIMLTVIYTWQYWIKPWI